MFEYCIGVPTFYKSKKKQKIFYAEAAFTLARNGKRDEPKISSENAQTQCDIVFEV